MANSFGDLQNTALIGASQFPAAVTATGGLTSVDTGGANARAMNALLNVGTVSGTNPTLDVKMQESADGSTNWTDITGATFTQVTAASNLQLLVFKPIKRYVRAHCTIGGTSTPTFTFGCTVIASDRLTGLNTGGWVNETGGSYP
jgi:hypothetical protein